MLHTADHSYTGILSGKRRSSVTTILAEERYIEKSHYREGRQELGMQCHHLLHAYDMKWKFKAPDIYMRYLPPYQRFLEHTGIEIIDSEVEIEEPMLEYSGCLDKLCFHKRDGYGIMDVKFSSCGYLDWHERQTEMYRQGLLWHPKYKDLKISWKGGIIFSPDCEMPKLIPHNRIPGIERICSAIALVNADKHRHKIYMEEINRENGWFE